MGIQQSMVWVTFFMKALFVRPVYHSELHQMVRAVFSVIRKRKAVLVVTCRGLFRTDLFGWSQFKRNQAKIHPYTAWLFVTSFYELVLINLLRIDAITDRNNFVRVYWPYQPCYKVIITCSRLTCRQLGT
jgi:hypothetical protein